MNDGVAPLRLGFGLPVSGSWATAANMVAVAQRAEELGYHSLWAFQRLLHPAAGDWGPMYRSVHDPIVALAYAAAHTRRVRLGVAVLNAPFVAPIVLAKQLVTLDDVSGGRLDVGLGLGWAREEFAAVGTPYERRGARMEEFIACLTAMWEPDPVRFDGEFYSVPESIVAPKPLQSPHPPLLLGGSAPPALRRAGRVADGWISASRHDLTSIGADIAVIRAAASAAGRDPAVLRFIVRGVVRLDGADSAAADRGDGAAIAAAPSQRRPLTGTREEIRSDLASLHEAGVTEVFLDLNFDPRIGSPDADPESSMAAAEEVMSTFAPAASE